MKKKTLKEKNDGLQVGQKFLFVCLFLFIAIYFSPIKDSLGGTTEKYLLLFLFFFQTADSKLHRAILCASCRVSDAKAK